MVDNIAKSDGDFTRRIKVIGNDEISVLSQKINYFIMHVDTMILTY